MAVIGVPMRVGVRGDDERELRSRLARKVGLTLGEVDAWLAVGTPSWVARNARLLHAAGLTPEDAVALRRWVADATWECIGWLADAARMSGLDIGCLRWWAAAGLLEPLSTPTRDVYSYRRFFAWVTQARRYVAAAEGDQQVAARAAAAGLSVEETAALRKEGRLDIPTLEGLAALAYTPNQQGSL